ncbi:hypothetical protein CCACVL1_27447 [Corchorus capsularis]|uniref:Uncharacterized protein n=1 Tax=Corchorus capsularis TaxID=210143 RepID=A0A1R3GA72_COCAP|nr:hypothetical protein CCACVL1_27447 [Corchorus capsularis]
MEKSTLWQNNGDNDDNSSIKRTLSFISTHEKIQMSSKQDHTDYNSIQ